MTFLLGIAATNASADIFYQGIDFQYQPWGIYGGVDVGTSRWTEPYTEVFSLFIRHNPFAYPGYSGFDFAHLGTSEWRVANGIDVSHSDTSLEFTWSYGPSIIFGPILPTPFLPSGLTNFFDWSLRADTLFGSTIRVYFSPGDTSNTETVFGIQSFASPDLTLNPSHPLNMIDVIGGNFFGIPLTPGHGVYVNIPPLDLYGNVLPGPLQYQLLIGNTIGYFPYGSWTVAYLETGDHILSEAPEPASWTVLTCAFGALSLSRYLRKRIRRRISAGNGLIA